MDRKSPAPAGAPAFALDTARRLVREARLDEAEAAYSGVLADAPDDVEALNFVAMRALARGRHAEAMARLQQALRREPENPVTLAHLGLAYAAAGRLDDALRPLRRAAKLAPDSSVTLLHLGSVSERLGVRREALESYLRGITMAQRRGQWLSEASTAPALRAAVLHAMQYVDRERRDLLTQALAPLRDRHGWGALQRVEHCVSNLLAARPAPPPDARQRPKFLYFPGLESRPYHDRARFAFLSALQARTAEIRAELDNVLSGSGGFEPFLKFQSPEQVPYKLQGSFGTPAWDAYFFYRHGERYDANCERCPVTAALLDALPLVRIAGHAPEICFSVLSPGTHILPHHGVTNTRLVAHLPLRVPGECALRVGGEDHAWREGHCVVFDDTFEHEAWNRSRERRVVLILDLWHPDLTEAERAGVTDVVGTLGELNRRCGLHPGVED